MFSPNSPPLYFFLSGARSSLSFLNAANLIVVFEV